MNKNYIFSILGSDKRNMDMVSTSLWNIKDILFTNLYEAQKSIINIDRFDFTMDQYMKYSTAKCSYSVPIQFISEQCRELYRTSKLCKKELTMEEIISNPDIFYYSLLLFIDGELYTCPLVYPQEDKLIVSFKLYGSFTENPPYVRQGFTQYEMEQFIKNKTKMTIFILQNHETGQILTNRFTLMNRVNIPEYRGYDIIDIDNINNLNSENSQYIGFITKDDDRLYKYSPITVTEENNRVYFDADEVNSLTNRYTYIRFIKSLNLLDSMVVPSNKNYFTIELKDMPIPVESIIVFRKTDTGIKFDHDTKIEIYYPNYYRVIRNHDDDVILYIHYKDDTTLGSIYMNELQLYYDMMSNILDKFEDGSIPDTIKNYKPISTKYSVSDYKTKSLDSLQYKNDSLIELIRKHGDFYKIYLNKLIGHTPTFYIDVSEITNLHERIRTDSSNESSNNVLKFNEPCYLFTFKKDNNNLRYSLTINNKMYIPEYTVDDGSFIYVYIPTSIINNDTMIYVEKLFNAYYKKVLNISSTNDYVNIDLPVNNHYVPKDIFLVYNGEYVDEDKYELYTSPTKNVYKLITYDDFYEYDNIYVKLLDTELLNKDITVSASRLNFFQTNLNDTRFELFSLNRNIQRDESNIMVYKNGRLLPKDGYSIRFVKTATGHHTVRSLTRLQAGDSFIMRYTNKRYYKVYDKKVIDESGLVNLFKEINKPFDFKWYDVYLNGLRLTPENIDILAPYLILIKNVPTRLNLEIYQIDLDGESYNNIDEDIVDVTNDIYDNIPEIKQSILENNEPLEDTMEDIYDEIVLDYTGIVEDVILDVKFINPDLEQITDDLRYKYSNLIDSNGNYIINADNPITIGYDPYINSDKDEITYIVE